jgi:hypothetical protein
MVLRRMPSPTPENKYALPWTLVDLTNGGGKRKKEFI